MLFYAGAVLVHVKSMAEVEARAHQGNHILSSYSTSQPVSSPPSKLYNNYSYTVNITMNYCYTVIYSMAKLDKIREIILVSTMICKIMMYCMTL